MGEYISPQKKFNTGLIDYSVSHHEATGPYAQNLNVDALIIGGGFSGIFMLKSLRDRGYKTVIYEAGNDLGGTWRWNNYPGAGVDTEMPAYELSWPEVWETWNWSTNYPNYAELRQYFDHIDKVVGIKKDCAFNTVVVGGRFDTETGRWEIRTQDGRTANAKWLILGAGFAAKPYLPDWPGIDKFKGVLHHSSFWPRDEVNVRNKRCAVIGTGASGVQIVQNWGPQAGDLKVFQRTPNLCFPMRRRPLSREEQEAKKGGYAELFKTREATFGGLLFDWMPKSTTSETPEAREAFYSSIWKDGGFKYWVGTYIDNLVDAEANKYSYEFWRKQTQVRINDPRKRELLAPEHQPHFLGIKRPSLEVDYYEQFNRPNVDVVDVRNNPIKEFSETGIVMEDGTSHELDVVALATGFDVVTGTTTQLGLESINGTSLKAEWASGADTYLGTTISGYPNMFQIYGAHGPTLLSNGPATIELQGRWISAMIDKLSEQNTKFFNPTRKASDEWKQHIIELNNATLFPTTRSTFMGGSIPGKIYEPMCYVGGIPAYKEELYAALDSMTGFDVITIDDTK